MIKITGRHNVIYIIQLVIWSNIRTIDKIILSHLYNFNKSAIFTVLMFLGELTSGALVYKYQSKYLRKKEDDNYINKVRKRSTSIQKYIYKPNSIKIYILLFFATFLDFVEFIITSFYIKNFSYISSSLDSRLYNFLVICNGIAFIFLLKIKIYKHQKLSLIIIFICLIITIASEYAFQIVDGVFTYDEFTLALVLILIEYFDLALMDIIDKYLLEFESVDPFFIIMIEGLIGFLFSILFCFIENPIENLKHIYNKESTASFCLFVILLLLFYLLTAFRVAFRIMVNKIYSPMVLTLSDYFLNPIYIIYYFFTGDFKSKEGRDIFYFVLNLILSILTAFSTFIYNEFIVLFCFGLEKNTYDQITKRSLTEEVEMNIQEIMKDTLKDIDDDEESDLNISHVKTKTYNIYV